jgi:glutathione peroxidase
MKNEITIGLIVMAMTILTVCARQTLSEAKSLTEKSIYDFVLKDIDGNDIKMGQYRGKVLMVVNTASQCGYTPQYEGLQKIYSKYKDEGFFVLGFPANNFGAQEPGSDEEIKNFCNTRFKVTFQMVSKISVQGSDKHPVYKFLTEKETNPDYSGEIKWNFNKFLIDKTGKVVARFDSGVAPEDSNVIESIEKALK